MINNLLRLGRWLNDVPGAPGSLPRLLLRGISVCAERHLAGDRWQPLSTCWRHRAAMLGTPRGTSYLWAVRLATIPRMAREQLNARVFLQPHCAGFAV